MTEQTPKTREGLEVAEIAIAKQPLIPEDLLKNLPSQLIEKARGWQEWKIVSQEIGRGGEIICVEKRSGTSLDGTKPSSYEVIDNGLVGLAKKSLELDARRREARESGPAPHDLVWNAKAAKRRLRRMLEENKLHVAGGQDDRDVIRAAVKLLGEELIPPRDEIDPSEAEAWLSSWLVDPVEAMRRHIASPLILTPEHEDSLRLVVREAVEGFELGLFRVAVIATRTVIEHLVETLLDRYDARRRLPDKDQLGDRISVLHELPRWVLDAFRDIVAVGNRAAHDASVRFIEDEVLRVLKKAAQLIEWTSPG